MTKQLTISLAALLFATTVAQAGSIAIVKQGIHPHATSASFGISTGPDTDTCTSSDRWGMCDLDTFEASCDAAGGGLSKEPGGGVTCDTGGWKKD